MNTLKINTRVNPTARICRLNFQTDAMEIFLSDGRAILVPLAWYPALANATNEQLRNYEISPSGYGIHWPNLDEDLSLLGFLYPNAAPLKSK